MTLFMIKKTLLSRCNRLYLYIHICIYTNKFTYIHALTVKKRGHVLKERGEGYMGGVGRGERKGEIQLFYNLKKIPFKL